MDRNTNFLGGAGQLIKVALRKESVDRNSLWAWMGGLNYNVALRKESVDRNTSIDNLTQGVFKSLSARRAWIEISKLQRSIDIISQSLSARRAWIEIIFWICRMFRPARVALRKESVDRNTAFCMDCQKSTVALRKESVDRNIIYLLTASGFLMSLSARRAWIEILLVQGHRSRILSLSARRAWIEIFGPPPQVKPVRVALRKESVDRNTEKSSCCGTVRRRSPQGERG